MAEFEVDDEMAETLRGLGLPPRPLVWMRMNGRPDIGAVMNAAGARPLAVRFVQLFNDHSRSPLAPVIVLLAYTLSVSRALDRLTADRISRLGDDQVYAVALQARRWVDALSGYLRQRRALPMVTVSQTLIGYISAASNQLDEFIHKEERRIMEIYMVPDLAGIAMQYVRNAPRQRRNPQPKPRARPVKKSQPKPRSRTAGKLSSRV